MLNEEAKKDMLLKIPHGLYICGVRNGEEMNGFTVSWLMQSSFKPPMVVACVKEGTTSYDMIVATEKFAISFLEETQKDLAAQFFKPRTRVGNKFAEVEFYEGEQTGCPIIQDSLGYVECKVVSLVAQGDHHVFVGEVIGAGSHREGKPLLLESTGWQYGG
ncbi:MAG: flavin reductase [Synechococcaceae cyanobacterium RL_1_2]|nr:flavin reductase [Synechococcaceae cyanobacterium RL_1_2]